MNSLNSDDVQHLLSGVWSDLQQRDVLWQIAVLAACIGIGWLVSRLIQQHDRADVSSIALNLGIGGLRAVIWPLVALLLVVAARPLLAEVNHVNLLRLAVPLLGSMVLIRALVYLARRVFSHSAVLAAFERTIALVIWAGFALHISGVLPEIIDLFERIGFTLGRQRVSVWTVLNASFWIGMILMIALWIGNVVEVRLMRADSLHASLRTALSRVLKALLVFMSVLITLPLVGIDLTLLSVFGGAFGVGLGFGLQKIASNYMSGFIILLDRSVRIGDMITADNFSGEVRAITTRYVVVRALDGREAIVPNEKMITDTVINHSYTDKQVRVAIQIQVSYQSELERALEILKEVAMTHPRVLREPAPNPLVLKFADSGVDLELGFWIKDPELGTLNVRSEISLMVWGAFKAQKIEIPYPQREVRLVGETGLGGLGRPIQN